MGQQAPALRGMRIVASLVEDDMVAHGEGVGVESLSCGGLVVDADLAEVEAEPRLEEALRCVIERSSRRG